jgi:hypothetical protein
MSLASLFPSVRRLQARVEDIEAERITVDADALMQLAEHHAPGYKDAAPYPHAVIDGFLPVSTALKLAQIFPAPDDPVWVKRPTPHPNQPGKRGTGHVSRLEEAPPFLRQMLGALNSYPVLHFLERLTGIERLIPDPYFFGGGAHQILPGGWLDIHCDFNFAEHLRLFRRINLLIYLNAEWREEYGGHLELWDAEMSECVNKVLPVLNRAVVFNTTRHSYHGHPDPLRCPANMTRNSLAFYYYTTEPDPGDPDPRLTQWQRRPQDAAGPPNG